MNTGGLVAWGKVGLVLAMGLLLGAVAGGRVEAQGDHPLPAPAAPAAGAGLLANIKAVSAGYDQTCALTTSGGVKCWGDNRDGQLGDGVSNPGSRTPVNVSGLGSGAQAVAAHRTFACALTAGGGIQCWGRNDYGQLGDGSSANHATPVNVSGLGSGVQVVAAGLYHACALTAGGGVKCWGDNEYGQLGDGTTTNSPTPVNVSGLPSGVLAVAAGYGHTCALLASGIKCWGRNFYGQLGDGTATDSKTPVDVSGLTSGAQAIAAGNGYTCALTTGGGVQCWGANYDGQLGSGTGDNSRKPVDVLGLTSGVEAITAGNGHACALTTGGGVQCWGQNNLGQVGDGTTTNQLAPVAVNGLTSSARAVSAGWAHTCIVLASGGVQCWGWNDSGQLGDDTLIQRLTPVDVVDGGSAATLNLYLPLIKQ